MANKGFTLFFLRSNLLLRLGLFSGDLQFLFMNYRRKWFIEQAFQAKLMIRLRSRSGGRDLPTTGCQSFMPQMAILAFMLN